MCRSLCFRLKLFTRSSVRWDLQLGAHAAACNISQHEGFGGGSVSVRRRVLGAVGPLTAARHWVQIRYALLHICKIHVIFEGGIIS